MKKIFLILTLCLAIFPRLFSQVIPETVVSDSTVLYDKLYLHTDREVYSPGDTLWFKSYLASGINNKLIPGFKNVYVQLLADDGKIIDDCLMLSINGFSHNDIELSDSLSTGSYTIRAYTKYLQNFGEESLFHKKIIVADAIAIPASDNESANSQTIDVQFLPEGGNMVLNAPNYVAFKATDESGKGIPVSGKITDENGEEIVSFESKYNGMGTFVMMPKEGKKYVAQIAGHPEFSYQFKEILPEGIALHYRPEGNNMIFSLNRNIKSGGERNLVLITSHKGQELFREEVKLTGFQHPVKIFKGFFPVGISKITVQDDQNNVLAERLIFVRNENGKILQINSDKKEYNAREKVELNIQMPSDKPEEEIEGGLSLAVVNEDYFSKDGISQTIESYLLLDSELKGPVESPASCFVDEENISADEKLDLVMMVNGWRHYYWDDLEKYFNRKLPNWADVGLTISGRVEKLFGKKPVVGGEVELGPFSSQFTILKDTTGEDGRFSFKRVYLKDSALIMINADKRNGSSNVEIYNETPPVFDSLVPMEAMNSATRQITVPDRFYRTNYYRQLAHRKYELEHGTILLGGVDVLEDKPFAYSYIRALWGTPDNTFNVAADPYSYINIVDYIEFNVQGVYVKDTLITYRDQPVSLLLDGFNTDFNTLEYLPMGDISRIDLYKSSVISSLFGSEGGGFSAVLSVLTKSPSDEFYHEWHRIIHGRITPHVRGFKQAREFYSPKYPLDKLKKLSDQKPDFRPTMYWNPNVVPGDGKASLSFFTSDLIGKYRVVAEGISKNGTPVFGTTTLEVVGE